MILSITTIAETQMMNPQTDSDISYQLKQKKDYFEAL
jgi:hypothetical protein